MSNIWITLFLLALRQATSQSSTSLSCKRFLDINSKTPYRLPTGVLPSIYVIKLTVNLSIDEFSFAGITSILIRVSGQKKNMITLHAKDLEIDEEYTTLTDLENSEIFKPFAHSIEDETDFLNICFETPLSLGKYWLTIRFTGKLNEFPVGIFKTSYINENEWLVATKFEPFYARQAFPCFDEPAMKSQFLLSIEHSSDYRALSNMPVISITKDSEDSQIICTSFDVTPYMSTYLLAFVVSDFNNMSSKDGKFLCWAQKNYIHNCNYAVDKGPIAVKALEDYTGRKYGVPKIGNVAIPNYISSGLESWGLISYRDTVLLYEEGVTTTFDREKILTTISHELAHEWFGNIVTPSWWDNLWLSEGLAHYLQYIIADKVEPNSRYMDKMVLRSLQERAFTFDAAGENDFMTIMPNSKPDISRKFKPEISYNKAGCVLRMISHVVTESVFQNQLRQYIENNAFDVATAKDFSNAFSTAAVNLPEGLSMKEFFVSWTDQPGYPVINVNRVAASLGTVSINQMIYPAKNWDTQRTQLWWIPINFATQDNPNFSNTQPSSWISPNEFAQNVPLKLDSNKWFIVNKQQTGYYRVNYDDRNWALIAAYLDSPNYSNIHVLNRAQLLDDSFNFAQDGHARDYSIFLSLSRYLAREIDYVPWYSGFTAFAALDYTLRETDTHEKLKLYILKLIEKVERTIGYSEMPGDDSCTKLNRIDVIKWACKMGSQKCANATHMNLVDHVSGLRKISPDLLEVSLCAGMRTANLDTRKKTFELYLSTKNEKTSQSIALALSCSTVPEIREYYSTKFADPNFKTKTQSFLPSFFTSIAQNVETGLDIILDFMEKNAETMSEDFGKWLSSQDSLDVIFYSRPTDSQLEKLIQIADAIPAVTPQAKDRLKSLWSIISSDLSRWLDKYEPSIRSFLLSHLN